MDHDMLRGALEAATCQVLEEAAFVFAAPVAESTDESSWQGSVVQAQLSFTGPVCGRFLLAASSELCAALAADMTGEPEADDGTEEVLGEILNMLAGITLDRALQADGPWELGVPEVTSVSSKEYLSGPSPSVRVRLDTEEQEPVEAAVFLETGAS